MNRTNNQNEKVLEKLQGAYDNLWEIFMRGDEKSGTRAGDIRVYEKIAGVREVAKGRLAQKEKSTDSVLSK